MELWHNGMLRVLRKSGNFFPIFHYSNIPNKSFKHIIWGIILPKYKNHKVMSLYYFRKKLIYHDIKI